jgi:hypothetical protein
MYFYFIFIFLTLIFGTPQVLGALRTLRTLRIGSGGPGVVSGVLTGHSGKVNP